MSGADRYHLGVDLGTTYTAAAVGRNGQVRTVGLGDRAAAIPSVLHVADDGTVLVGELAERRGPTQPDRVAREFKRRIGDPTPLLLGGTPYSAEALTARLLRSVIDKVTALEGGPPDTLAVTHPANWGPYKRDLFASSIDLAGVTAALLSEPEAAAIAYAANARVEPGSLVAVYDLGGGTFDAAVLRKHSDNFAILGRPEGIERLGGIDFDEAVIGHVRNALGGALDQVDLDDPAALAALVRLRRECVEAKEALSTDTETAIPVLLPGVQTEVRLTRGEFERMVRPTLTATIDALQRALVSACVDSSEVTAVLLVGGSSRIPLVAELVSDAFGRPVAVDADPKHAVALGAAHAALLKAQPVAAELDKTMPIAVAGSAAYAGASGVDTRRRHEIPLSQLLADQHARPPAVVPAQQDREPVAIEDLPPLVLARQRRRRSPKAFVQAAAVLMLALIGVGAGAFYSTQSSEGDRRVGAGAVEHATDQPLERAQADADRALPALQRAEDDPGERSGAGGQEQQDAPDVVDPDAAAVKPTTRQGGTGTAGGSSAGSSDREDPPSTGGGRPTPRPTPTPTPTPGSGDPTPTPTPTPTPGAGDPTPTPTPTPTPPTTGAAETGGLPVAGT